jgi:signal transduction histidine kinase
MQIASRRILIVDDEPNVLRTLEAILREEDYSVDACGDGEQALQAIRERHYDLVLTDLKMPNVDGLAVLAEVRKRSPNTVTVMLTGYGSVDSAIEAVQLGAYEYLVKPAEVPELKAAVRRALERKRLSEIDTLYRINRTLTSSLDRAVIAGEVRDAVMRVLGVAHARVMVLDRESSIGQQCAPQLPPPEEGACGDPSAPQQLAEDADLIRVLRERGLLTKLESGKIITSENSDPISVECARLAGVRSCALLPGIVAQRLVCVLWADNGSEPYEFHASALRFLQALTSQAALVLENASLVNELQRNNDELATANQKLRDLDKLKSQFLRVATHELRTPLTMILGYNEMLAETLEDRLDPEESNTLRESVAACKRLIRLVNSMLDINQIESGKMKMNVADSSIADIISGVMSLFQHAAEKKHIELRTQVPARLPTVRVDPERIQQVLINLIGNALKFTNSGGTVTISARLRPEANALEVAVTDTGVGIPEADQTRIFDEFAQIQIQVARRQREGSGLGLAIARRIVEAHQGSIQVSSEPGHGSTFTFTVPIRTGVAAITAMSA